MQEETITVRLRLYEELNRVMPEEERKTAVLRRLPSGASLGALVESLGLRRDEVDLALVNSRPASFARILEPGDLVSLYPEFESLDIRGATALRGEPLRNPRFVAERSLAGLARLLARRGYDCVCPAQAAPEDLAGISRREKRIFLTRDRDAARRFRLDRCVPVSSEREEEQLREVMRRLQLEGL